MKALMILAPANFRDEEFQVPKDLLARSGITVVVAGLQMKESTGMLGLKARPDVLLDDVKIDGYDALVVPGGRGAREYLANDAKVLETVRDAYGKGRIVASICSAGLVLANAGILKGKNATVFPTAENVAVLKAKGANYTGDGVVSDGNVITASGPEYSEEFANRIIRALKNR